MIKRVFWEKVADAWSKKDEVEIPEILVGVDVPDEDLDEDVEEWDDFLADLGFEEVDLTDL